MTDTKAMRVVPSGKVYRQMFDAQLQLSKSLTKVGERQKSLPAIVKVGQLPVSVIPAIPASAPVVRLTREDTQHGLLSPRQATWAEAYPNDPYTENPVLYKQYKEFVLRQQGSSIEANEAGKDVRGLPDTVVPIKTGSDIIERIEASRKARHEAAVEDMHQELGVISADMEPKISKVSTAVLQDISDSDTQIANMLARIEKDQDLLTYTLPDLNKLWEEILEYSPLRQQWISDLDTQLKELEDERMSRIRKVFQDYAKLFEKISYLLPPDLSRFLDRESQALNQACLSNRRAYADLFVRLMSADIEREKTQHTQWRRRVEDWKNLKINMAVEQFTEFMQSEEVINPSGVSSVQDFMTTELQILNEKRLDLIRSLSDLKPPSSTKSAVYNWRLQMLEVTKELDTVTQMHMSKVHDEMEKVCQTCLDWIENVKLTLMDAGVLTDTRAKQMIEEHMLPLVGEQQKIFENNLETMEKAQEAHCKKMEVELHSLFKFAQGVAHLWDVHEIGLAKQERSLQEKLEECRHNHDYMNQDKEANLDIVMDRMRQDATEEALKDSLTKALEMLDKTSESYAEFHKEQTDIVQSYPTMVESELDTFDSSVCMFFSVDRIHPEEKAQMEAEAAEAAAAAEAESMEATESARSRSNTISARSSTTAPKKQPPKGKKPEEEEPPKPIVMAVTEVLSTERGTTFYVLKVAGEHGIPEEGEESGEDKAPEKGSPAGTDRGASKIPPPEPEAPASVCGALITEIPVSIEEEDGEKPDYILCVDLSPALILQAKKLMRLNFLNHLEVWCDQARDRSSSVVIAKCEELNSELDLRLHLHQPRSRRAELDVHNVRAAELVMHAERVTRHCKGIGQSLNELRSRFFAMSSEHNKLANKFRQEIEALEVVFINATKSSVLVSLQNQLSINLEKFMTVIRTSLRQFRQHLDETLQMLRESNARFIKSFKLFSDGGNFCPEEIEEYRKRLEKMSQKIDSAEGSIMSELEGMESKRLDVATKVSNEFEDRFKSHMFDLLFMEKIARWLTNTQVRIKAEVAASNSQAQTIVQHLKDLERRIDACEKPNMDKEQITSSQLNEFVKVMMETFHQRSAYLNCLKSLNRPPSNVATGGQASESFHSDDFDDEASKVGFMADGTTAVSKAGRQPSEDPSINVIKSILKNLRRPKPGAKTDRKVLLFGEKEVDETSGSGSSIKEETHFMASVQRTLREALDGLQATAEAYYRQKGQRPVTRPQVLQETYEQCQEVVTQKLQSYYLQCDDYHNQCLQEFRQQLTRVEQLTARVPALVINDLVKEHVGRAQDAQKKLQQEFQVTLDEISNKQKSHENSLRPTMGHPHLAPQLEDLCQEETTRHDDILVAVAKHRKNLQASAVEQAKTLLDALSRLNEQQLLQYDGLLVVDDVEKGRVEPTRYPTSELIRRRNAGEPLEDDEDKDALPRGKGIWLGIPSNQLVTENRPTKIQLTSTVQTAKTSLGHSSTVKARDSAYEDYKAEFERTLATIEEEKERMVRDEQHWTTSWLTSVQRIRDLY